MQKFSGMWSLNNFGNPNFHWKQQHPYILRGALTLTLLKWRIWRAPNNASRWQMGFNLACKGFKLEPGIRLYMTKCPNQPTRVCKRQERQKWHIGHANLKFPRNKTQLHTATRGLSWWLPHVDSVYGPDCYTY